MLRGFPSACAHNGSRSSGRLEPERSQASSRLLTPALAEGEEAIEIVEMQAIAIRVLLERAASPATLRSPTTANGASRRCRALRRKSLDRTDIGRSPRRRERVFLLRVFGRLPVSGVTRCSAAGVRKASGEETAGGVCAGSGVGLWRFSLCMPRSLDFERGSRPSNHRGVGFGRRVQNRSGGLVVSDLRFGGRRRD